MGCTCCCLSRSQTPQGSPRLVSYSRTLHSVIIQNEAELNSTSSIAYITALESFTSFRERSQLSTSAQERKIPSPSTRLSESDIQGLVELLAEHAHKWEMIGSALGFTSGALKNIGAKQHLFINAPLSYLREMLEMWVQWTAESNGKYATLQDLVNVMKTKTVGLSVAAEEIEKKFSSDPSVVLENLHFGRSPILMDYIKYLKSHFKHTQVPVDEWPWLTARKYINLVINNKMYTVNVECNKVASNASISLVDLLKPNKIKRLLVEGAPGVGKSTMSWEICQKWGREEGFQEYYLVVMLRFRDSWVQRAEKLSDLFQYYNGDSEREAQIAKEISENNHGNGVLLIFEGYNEVPLPSKESLFYKLFSGVILPNATVMVTTRPSCSYKLRMKCIGVSSQIIEVVGFGEKEINEYMESHFDVTSLHNFKEYLYPHIKSLMCVPLNSAIVTHVYQSCKINFKYDCPYNHDPTLHNVS